MNHLHQKYLQLILYVITIIAAVFIVIGLFKVNYETQRQGEINQKYIRCIILLPASTYKGGPTERAKAVDECAIKSKLPDEM